MTTQKRTTRNKITALTLTVYGATDEAYARTYAPAGWSLRALQSHPTRLSSE